MADLLQQFVDALETGQGEFEDRVLKTVEIAQRERERKKNQSLQEINMIPKLANLIRDEDSLSTFEKTVEGISERANNFSETSSYAPYIKGISENIRNDYDAYSGAMETGAQIIDSPNFLSDQKDFINLGDSIKNMANEDGTPKYEGTLDFLTKENDRINTILGRAANASKGTQFRYNKNSKYTDQEIKNKLESYQQKLGVAVQTAIGNGEITPQEAEFIMLGDLNTYKTEKKEKIKLLNNQYKLIDRTQQTIQSQIQRLQLKDIKDEDANDLARLFATEFAAQGSDQLIDTDLSTTSISSMIEELKEKNKQLNLSKDRTMSSYKAWQGMPMFDAPKASDKEASDLLKNITIDDGSDVNNPLNVSKKSKRTTVPKDQQFLPPKEYNKKEMARKYKISLKNINKLEEEWAFDNTEEDFESWIDLRLKPAGFDDDVEKIWKNLSKEDKKKYKTLSNFKQNWKF